MSLNSASTLFVISLGIIYCSILAYCLVKARQWIPDTTRRAVWSIIAIVPFVGPLIFLLGAPRKT